MTAEAQTMETDSSVADTTDATVLAGDTAADGQGSTALTQDAGESSVDDQVGDGAENAHTPKAPETYADFTFAEGVQANAEVMAAFQETARELDLSQEGAQRVVDLGSQLVQQTLAAVEQQKMAEINGWKEQFESALDSAQVKVAAVRAAKTHLSKETLDMLDATGLGNYGPLIRDIAKLDALTKEDQSVGGSAPDPSVDPARALFGQHGFK